MQKVGRRKMGYIRDVSQLVCPDQVQVCTFATLHVV